MTSDQTAESEVRRWWQVRGSFTVGSVELVLGLLLLLLETSPLSDLGESWEESISDRF